MWRCFFISVGLHMTLIIGLVILTYVAPRTSLPDRINITLLPGNANLPAGSPGLGASQDLGVDALPPPAPKPTPAAPKPPAPRATPKPIVQPKPAPKPPAPKPVQHAVPFKTKPVEPAKKVINRKAKKNIVEALPTPTPKPAPPEEKQVATADDANRRIVEEAQPEPAPAVAPAPVPDSSGPAIDPSLLGGDAPPATGPTLTTQSGQLGVMSGSSNGANGGGGGSPLDRLRWTYFRVVLNQIERNFKPPVSRAGLTCQVRFIIQKDGTITNIQIVRSTGVPSWDQFAVRALDETRKVLPLYDGSREPYLDVVVVFNFEKKI